jgi:hypothetical protein
MPGEGAIAKVGTTRFPFINLAKSVERAKLLFEADERGREMSIAAAFELWGYSGKSSGGFQTVAALKSYGLLKEADGGDSRKLGLSDYALRYFRDERIEEKLKLLKVFAIKPKLISALWKEWGAAPPADTIARSQLKTEVGLNDQSARSLLAIYKENVAYAVLKGEDSEAEIAAEKEDDAGAGDPSIVWGGARVGDLIQWESAGELKLERPTRVRLVSADGQYVAIDGSETGIPMDQVIVETRAPEGKPQPPIFPRGLGELLPESAPTQPGEAEWMRNRLGGDTVVRLLVTGDMGPKEIGKLIRLLKAQQAVLTDDDDLEDD